MGEYKVINDEDVYFCSTNDPSTKLEYGPKEGDILPGYKRTVVDDVEMVLCETTPDGAERWLPIELHSDPDLPSQSLTILHEMCPAPFISGLEGPRAVAERFKYTKTMRVKCALCLDTVLICRMMTICGDERHALHRSCFNQLARTLLNPLVPRPPENMKCPVCNKVCDYTQVIEADQKRRKSRKEPMMGRPVFDRTAVTDLAEPYGAVVHQVDSLGDPPVADFRRRSGSSDRACNGSAQARTCI